MKKSPGELDAILKNLSLAYEEAFKEPLDSDVMNQVFEEYIIKCKKDFIKNRIDGLDPLGVKYLASPRVVTQLVEPNIVESKKLGRPKIKKG